MKKLLLFLLFFVSFQTLKAQCNQGISQGTITPSTSWQTITTKSEKYYSFSAIAGNVYEFSYCSCNGGSMTYAGQLSLDSSTTEVNGGNFVAYNSGYCADANNAPEITWQCFASGTYSILTTHSGCATTAGTTATLAYIMYTPSLCYTVASTAYSPDPFTSGTQPAGLNQDDGIETTPTAIGFTFCYNGTFYDSVIITTNGYMLFTGTGCDVQNEITTNCFPNASYTTQKIPFTNTTYTGFMAPAILFPWYDGTPNVNGTVKYKLYGVAPNRRFTVAYNNVSIFDCDGGPVANDSLITSEVQLYETSNNIKIQTLHATNCPAWISGGKPVEGLIDATGYASLHPAGRDKGAWIADLEAWLFTPSCCSVLPITLLQFNCSDTTNGISLHWITATETNSNHYVLERSIDGIHYNVCGIVPAAGNSENTRYYHYLDTLPLNGANYYQLEEVDLDGASYIYGQTECEYSKVEYGNIYPNPNSGSFTISIGPSVFYQSVTITDLLGKEIYYTQYAPNSNPQNYIINLNGNNKGIYIVKIISNNEDILYVKKLIVY